MKNVKPISELESITSIVDGDEFLIISELDEKLLTEKVSFADIRKHIKSDVIEGDKGNVGFSGEPGDPGGIGEYGDSGDEGPAGKVGLQDEDLRVTSGYVVALQSWTSR